MAVSDQMIIVLLLCTLNYFMLWRGGWGKRILADLFYMIIGIGSNYILSIANYPWGYVIVIIAAIDLIYLVLNPDQQ